MTVALREWRPIARGPGAPGERSKVDKDDLPEPLPGHVGIWLERMLHEPGAGEEKPGRMALYRAAAYALRPGAPATTAYARVFPRWRQALQDGDGVRVRVVEIEAKSRILLHTASNQSVTDGGVLLHHTYGVPYLPGSALKGVLRRAVERAGGPELAAELLGPDRDVPGMRDAPDARGWLDLLDALWVPGTGTGNPASPLALDIVNPHHPDWYTAPSGKRQPARDFDSPVPTHRLSIAPGTRFLLALEWSGVDGDDPLAKVAERAMELLLDALEHDGIGSWASVGYGRLSPVGAPAGQLQVGSVTKVERAEAQAERPWQAAQLTRDPATRDLRASLSSGRGAIARGQAADVLFGTLSPEQQALLKKGRALRLEAQTREEGKVLVIAALRAGSA